MSVDFNRIFGSANLPQKVGDALLTSTFSSGLLVDYQAAMDAGEMSAITTQLPANILATFGTWARAGADGFMTAATRREDKTILRPGYISLNPATLNGNVADLTNLIVHELGHFLKRASNSAMMEAIGLRDIDVFVDKYLRRESEAEAITDRRLARHLAGMSIKNKDPIGTVSGLISVINPAWMTPGVGWALAVGSLVFSLTRSAPDAWGVASVRFADGEDNLNIDVAAEGESFGKDKARQTQQTLVDALQDQIDAQNQLIKLGLAQGGANAASYDDAALGLIAQRLPTLSWRANNLSDRGFTIVDIDALSGSQRYPYRRFDDDGVPFSADPSAWQPNPTEVVRCETGRVVTAGRLVGRLNRYHIDSASRRIDEGWRAIWLGNQASNDGYWRVMA